MDQLIHGDRHLQCKDLLDVAVLLSLDHPGRLDRDRGPHRKILTDPLTDHLVLDIKGGDGDQEVNGLNPNGETAQRLQGGGREMGHLLLCIIRLDMEVDRRRQSCTEAHPLGQSRDHPEVLQT